MEINDASLLVLHEDVGQCYDAVARSTARAVGAESCHLALYDAATDELIAQRPRYGAGPGSIPQFRFPLDAAPASATVVRTGRPYVSNDPARDPLYHPSVREHGVQCVLTVPVLRNDRISGLLYALNKPGGFTEDDVHTLVPLAAAAAVSLENIQRYAEERERRILSESLREVSRALVGTHSEDGALGQVLDQMWRVVRYQAAAAAVLEDGVLRVAAARGAEPGAELPLAEAGELRQAMDTRKLLTLADPAAVLPRLGLRPTAGRTLVAPLGGQAEVRGFLLAAFGREQEAGVHDAEFLGAFAEHAALFLEAGAAFRRERQARTRSAATARITRLVTTRHDTQTLFEALAPEILAASGADRVALYLRHQRNPVLVPAAQAGAGPAEATEILEHRLDMTMRPLRSFLELPRPLALEEGSPDLLNGYLHAFGDLRSLLIVPLCGNGEILGAISLGWRRRRPDPAHVEHLHDLAQQVGLALENARLLARLAHMATTDELTQIGNRRRFHEVLCASLARAARPGGALALVMADVDHLKKINDSLGHPAGDAAIKHVADAMRAHAHEGDLAARLGGEEFALVLPGRTHAQAVEVAEAVRRHLSSSAAEGVGTVTASIGVASYPADGRTEQQLVQAADRRLYAAKTGGRNRVCAAD